jgi:hypothetical protein
MGPGRIFPARKSSAFAFAESASWNARIRPRKAEAYLVFAANLFACRAGCQGARMNPGIQALLDRLGSVYVTVGNTMPRNRSRTKKTAEWGELELSLLLLVWRKGALTAERSSHELDGGASRADVRAALRLLEEHGLLAHSIENRTVVYRPIGARRQVIVRASEPPQISSRPRAPAG